MASSLGILVINLAAHPHLERLNKDDLLKQKGVFPSEHLNTDATNFISISEKLSEAKLSSIESFI